MERKIGDVFDFLGVTLEVTEETQRCIWCYFEYVDCRALKGDVLGFLCWFQ